MPHDFAHILYQLRRNANSTTFDISEALTIIRKITDTATITIKAVQADSRGPTYYVEDDALRRNYITNPSFEFDLTSWTQSITATGTTAADTAESDSASTSLKLVMTNSGGSGQVASRYATITGLSATEVWSTSVAVNFTALSNSKVILRMEFLNAGGAVQATHDIERTTVTSGFVTLDNDNRTAPSNTTQLRVSLILQSTASSATGTAYLDSVLAEKASTSGTYFDGDTTKCFWESGLHASETIHDVDGTAAIAGYFMVSA